MYGPLSLESLARHVVVQLLLSDGARDDILSQLETGCFRAVSDGLLSRILKYVPERLNDRMLCALIPGFAKELNVSKCRNVSLMGIAMVLKRCPQIQHLCLKSCSHLMCDDLFEYMGLKQLPITHLSLERTDNIEDTMVHVILAQLPHLTTLNLSGNSKLTDNVFQLHPEGQRFREMMIDRQEGSCPYKYSLTSVDVSGCRGLSSVAVLHLSSLCGPRLKHVNLSWTKVGCDSLLFLAGYNLGDVTSLYLQQTDKQSSAPAQKIFNNATTPLIELSEEWRQHIIAYCKMKCNEPAENMPGNNGISQMTQANDSKVVQDSKNTPGMKNSEQILSAENEISNFVSDASLNVDTCVRETHADIPLTDELSSCCCGKASVNMISCECGCSSDQNISSCSENNDQVMTAGKSNTDMIHLTESTKDLLFTAANSNKPCTYSDKTDCDVRNANEDNTSINLQLSNSDLNTIEQAVDILNRHTRNQNSQGLGMDDNKCLSEVSHDGIPATNRNMLDDTPGLCGEKSVCEEPDVKTDVRTDIAEFEDAVVKTKFNDRNTEGNVEDIELSEIICELVELKSTNNENKQMEICKLEEELYELRRELINLTVNMNTCEHNKQHETISGDSVKPKTDTKESNIDEYINKLLETFEIDNLHKERRPMFQCNLISLDVQSIGFKDKVVGLFCLEKFFEINKQLQKFGISWNGLSGQLMQALVPSLTDLREVDLVECVTLATEGVQSIGLGCHKLEKINLKGVDFFGDYGIRPLLSLSYVTSLCLAGSEITDASLLTIAKHQAETLNNLDLSWCEETITEKGINAICEKCTKLRVLYLPKCPISDVTLHLLAESGGQMIDLSFQCVDDLDSELSFSMGALATLAENLTYLRRLDISWNLTVTNEGIRAILVYCIHLEKAIMSGIKTITVVPFLPIIAGYDENIGFVDATNSQSKSVLTRSTVYAPNLRKVLLEYCDLVDENQLSFVTKACKGTLRAVDYYGELHH